MNEDDRAVEWSARRRRRNFLGCGVLGAAIALVALVAMLLGVHWAAGFLGGFAALSVTMLFMWRGERQAAQGRSGSSR